ncbi:hypothetical protein L1987_23518 [Smallanthus sonchifolius]|uniref:Uncharacterized protein n=1 Tax=Smallanthus sonchifolius TaxID=185202 RepID=A0ACB9IJ77_9ASTR|nr:hypothetical protein L1987_23518 [Smallanthus sonchifolius]
MEKSTSFSTNGFGYKDGSRSRSYAFNGPAATDGEMKRKKRIAEYNMFTTGTKIKSAFKWIKNKFTDGKCIKKGQILMYGATTVGAELALGENALETYMPCEGIMFVVFVLSILLLTNPIKEQRVKSHLCSSIQFSRGSSGIPIAM